MESKMEIMIFGQLTDVTGSNKIFVSKVETSEALLNELYASFPLLRNKKFLISIDQQVIQGSSPIHASSEVALLPPFSGG